MAAAELQKGQPKCGEEAEAALLCQLPLEPWLRMHSPAARTHGTQAEHACERQGSLFFSLCRLACGRGDSTAHSLWHRNAGPDLSADGSGGWLSECHPDRGGVKQERQKRAEMTRLQLTWTCSHQPYRWPSLFSFFLARQSPRGITSSSRSHTRKPAVHKQSGRSDERR